jgi:phenylacetic acid degradation protein paaN
MCTTTQDIFVPEGGIETDEGPKSFDEVAAAIASGVEGFLADDARAVHILGAIQADATMERINAASASDKAILKSRAVTHPDFPDARVQTPVIVKTDASDARDADLIAAECFGPVSYIVATADTAASLNAVRELTQTKGALSFGVYSTSEEVLEAAEEVAMDGGVALSMNLTGGVFVNQTAAFSDYHGTGANPAANAALSDAAYVANRFRVVQSRRHAA